MEDGESGETGRLAVRDAVRASSTGTGDVIPPGRDTEGDIVEEGKVNHNRVLSETAKVILYLIVALGSHM